MLDTTKFSRPVKPAPKARKSLKTMGFLAQELLFRAGMRTLITFLFLLTSPAFAAHGPGEGGGGDPMVQQFINMGMRLGYFYEANPFHARLTFKAEDFKSRIKAIDESVKDERIPDLIEFTEETLRDRSGVEKAARFLSDKGAIQVNRAIWKSYSEEERLILVTMEISGLLNADARYETATALVTGHGALVLSIPLENDGAFKMPGMRMVGQDPDQFGRIAEQDVLIDGGVLGSGEKGNKRVADFLENPAGDKDWFALLGKAKAMKRPAYMLLTGPNGNRVAILSFYETKYDDGAKGVASYWLQVYKTRQVYTGPCVGEARELPALQRIKNCFLNLDNYQFLDTIDHAKAGEDGANTLDATWAVMGSELKGRLLNFFALELSILEDMVHSNFITDYSSLVADPAATDFKTKDFRTIVLRATVAANGWEPSLVGPFPGTPFWVRAKKKNPAAIRLFSALKTLSGLGLGFLDHATRCELDGQEDHGPGFVAMEKLRPYYRAKVCGGAWNFYPRLEPEILDAMVKRGFYYDYPAEIWRLGASAGVKK